MAAQPTLQADQVKPGSENAPWNPALRIGLRFCVLYFGFYCLTTQVLSGLFPIPKVSVPNLAALAPIRAIVFWTAARIFHAPMPLVYTGSGSGDKTFDWVLAFAC